eukprot:scaffold1857_cov96-Skeletonema_dohrnii-CCMP3373.AAC.1
MKKGAIYLRKDTPLPCKLPRPRTSDSVHFRDVIHSLQAASSRSRELSSCVYEYEITFATWLGDQSISPPHTAMPMILIYVPKGAL